MPQVSDSKGRKMDVCMARDVATVTGRTTTARTQTRVTQPVTCGRRLKKDGTCKVHGRNTL